MAVEVLTGKSLNLHCEARVGCFSGKDSWLILVGKPLIGRNWIQLTATNGENSVTVELDPRQLMGALLTVHNFTTVEHGKSEG